MKSLPSHLCTLVVLGFFLTAVTAQAQDAPQMSAPVSYASLSQLNTILGQLEQTSQTTQLDLAKLRIDKWKTDSGTKRQTQSNSDSVQKNLHDALPEIVGQLRASPEDLAVTFKLYRNLSALYDVFSSVVESTGAFGSKDDFQSLDNDLSLLDQSRRSVGDRMDDLATAKDAEIKHLRTTLQATQASLAAAQKQKAVVHEEEAPRKPTSSTKKKPTAKSTTTKSTTKNSGSTAKPSGTTSKPSSTNQPSSTNPQLPSTQSH
jgi:hypothetical protein